MHSLPLSSVYTWGSGISTPLRLPMLNTEVVQVSLGRTQKMGVTKSGRLITWEVSWSESSFASRVHRIYTTLYHRVMVLWELEGKSVLVKCCEYWQWIWNKVYQSLLSSLHLVDTPDCAHTCHWQNPKSFKQTGHMQGWNGLHNIWQKKVSKNLNSCLCVGGTVA